jgi:large subunit ribosomal protein L24
MKSIKPNKQRKELYNAPIHLKRKWLSSHLDENLLLKYDKRSIPVIKGDTVKVMRGSYKGHEDKVVHVHVKKQYLEIEGLTLVKADNKKIAKPIHSSNIIITKLNLTDKWRRNKLEKGLSEETKKEIEKEAETQIKEIEKKQKEIEDEKRREEERLAAEESLEEEKQKKKPEEEKKPTEEKPKEKIEKEDKKEKKPETKKDKELVKKPKPKKKPIESKAKKVTSKKTVNKKEENK